MGLFDNTNNAKKCSKFWAKPCFSQ